MKQKNFGKGSEKIIERNVSVSVYLNNARKRVKSDDLVESNLLLVVSIANSYAPIMPIEDLVQEGNIGLIMAAKDYNEELGCAFSTFATPYIRNAILSAIESDSRLVRRPHNKQDGFVWNDSLDEPIDDGEGNTTSKADFLVGDMGIDEDFDELAAILSQCLDKLTERERFIVTKVYGIGTDVPMGYKVLADVLGMTEERVRQIHLGALKKMRP